MSEVCFNCSFTLPDNSKVKFCPSCLTQVRCKSCDEYLLKDAIGCVVCGTPISSEVSQSTSLNEIEFEQKGDSKKFKAVFSDNVGKDLVATFGNMVGAPVIKSLNNPSKNQSLFISKADNTIDAEVYNEDDDHQFEEALLRIFKIDGEKLIVQTNSLKEKSKIDKEIRMALLILLGFEHLHSSKEIKRSTLTDIMKKSKLNSSNFRGWISKSDEIVASSNGISLTPFGQEQARLVLSEVLNNDIIVGNINFSKISVKTKSRTRSKSNDSDVIVNRSSKTPKADLEKLIKEGFFKQPRTLSDIVKHLKDNYATTLKTTDISTYMSKYTKDKALQRKKGTSGYEYFN